MKSLIYNKTNQSIFCKISSDNGSKWTQGIIIQFRDEKNTMDIFLSSKNFYKFFDFKNKIVIKALDGDNEKIYIGSIDRKAIPLKRHSLKINIEKVLSFSNNRKYERFLVNYTAIIKYGNSTLLHVKLSNLSFGGINFFSTEDIKLNSKTSVKLNVSKENKINFSGKVIRKTPLEKGYRYSIHIKPLTDNDMDKLNSLIDFLLIQRSGINSDYKSYVNSRKLLPLLCLAFISIMIFVFNLYLQ